MGMRAHAHAVLCGLFACLATMAVGASAALAAPPSNDDRANAQDVTVPGSVDGTTVDATQEEDEPEACVSDEGSVWYRVHPKKGRVIAQLAANGDLDATLEVFRVQRSK